MFSEIYSLLKRETQLLIFHTYSLIKWLSHYFEKYRREDRLMRLQEFDADIISAAD